ncbi:MAG: hypothetical protein JXN10_04955 [Clostridia bacterium]|nr:hypothetical protein [Clostridia bacterium]MBN2882854.1 hypothetical protein [Clostridia bacterium]
MFEKPERKRREESFFGLHFDFHAKPAESGDIIPIGATTTEEMVQHIIDVIKPDFIQIDCKGHPGWTSYPTKLNNAYPVIEKDILKIWRKVTAENGVALYLHYSGVCDDFQCEKHPEWRRVAIEDDGAPDWVPKGVTSTFSPYVNEVVIPQFMELAGEYDVDGVWVDGECWGTQVDYSRTAIQAFKKISGIDISNNPPRKPGDDHWQDYSDFCREQFRNYLRTYTDAVHSVYPDFQIASNWAFSSKMPEKVSVNVDFLSGDYLWADSLNSARYEGRCLASQGKPWDLMAWGFRWRHGNEMERCPKHPKQLKQEAATVIAMGGGFQSYYPQKKDGSMHMWQVELMKEVSEFCRAREKYCHKAKFVPQVALINSTYDRYHRSKYLFQCDGEDTALQGIVQLLCEAGQSFEILSEHSIEERLREYPVVIIPETHFLEDYFIEKLLEYVMKGGSLLLMGTKSYELFGPWLGLQGVKTSGDFLMSSDGRTWAYNRGSVINSETSGIEGGRLTTLDGIDKGEGIPAFRIIDKGLGRIGFVFTEIGDIYLTRKSHVHRSIISRILGKLYEPAAEIHGSMYIDMSLMEKNGEICVNMVNTAGSHDDQDVFTIDEIPPVGPIIVKIRCSEKPTEVIIQPENTSIDFIWNEKGKYITVTVQKVDIHSILVLKS